MHWTTFYRTPRREERDGFSPAKDEKPPATIPQIPPPTNFFKSGLQKIDEKIFPQPAVAVTLPLPATVAVAEDPTGEFQDEELPDSEEFEPIITPPPRDFRAIANQLVTPILAQLAAFSGEDPRIDETLDQVRDLGARLENLLSEVRTAKIEKLQREHAQSAEACRAQLRAITEANRVLSEYQPTVLKVNGELESARFNLTQWLAHEPSLDDYPSAAKLAAWRKGKEEREAKVFSLNAKQGEIFEEDRRLRWNVTQAKNAFLPLRDRELFLRSELIGQPYRDPETGLVCLSVI